MPRGERQSLGRTAHVRSCSAYGCLKQDFFVFFSNSQGVALGVWFTLSCLPLLDAQVSAIAAVFVSAPRLH